MTKPLHVVYHCAAMGDWKQVVTEQFQMLREVGLTNLLVTHVGDELEWLFDNARAHGITINLRRHSPNIAHYETFAMLLIEQLAAESDTPILYFHTKGVSTPGDEGKRKWRKLMEKHVIRKWRENLTLLETHDVVGVDWLPCEHSHFVGNFWMARADWIRRLEPFTTFHHNMRLVRFSCEFWIGWAPNPKVYSYVCRGVMWYDLIKIAEHVGRTLIVTPAFCKASMLQDCLENIYQTPLKDVTHYILDNHYPVDEAENRKQIRALADRFGCTYLDSGGDIGLYRSCNAMMSHAGLSKEDIIMGCDPDDRPTPGWVDAFRSVMLADPSYAIVAATFPFYGVPEVERANAPSTPFFDHVRNLREETVAGIKVMVHPGVEMWKVACTNTRMLMEMGGLPIEPKHQLYGGQECLQFNWWRERGMKLGYVPSITAEHVKTDYSPSRFDAAYRTWKNAHLGGFSGRFADWLKQHGG